MPAADQKRRRQTPARKPLVQASALTKTISGYAPPLAVPWPAIWAGTGIVMAIALVASLWPAITVARSEPLELLQAGRASA